MLGGGYDHDFPGTFALEEGGPSFGESSTPVRWSAVTPDVNYCDGIKPDAVVEIEGTLTVVEPTT